ncbi:MAG: hypothetical protein K2P94_03495 [Rhodospirillaceae bacterium]|nr:hypothetical protein [Rhodospirillaceae bacterium]
MTSAVDSDLTQLRTEVSQLRGDMSRIMETLQNLVRHGAADIADRAQGSKADLQDAVRSKAAGLAQEIEEKPLTAALTSFAIGVFLGALVGGRR